MTYVCIRRDNVMRERPRHNFGFLIFSNWLIGFMKMFSYITVSRGKKCLFPIFHVLLTSADR